MTDNRQYRILVAATEGGLHNAASDWRILENTVREFTRLETNDDNSLGNIGAVRVNTRGWVAIAYKN